MPLSANKRSTTPRGTRGGAHASNQINAQPVTILGIDPGLTVTGYGLVRIEGDRHAALDFGTVAPPTQAPIAERLIRIHDALTDVIRDARPDEVAVEDFIVGHVRAAVAVGEARAVALLAAAQAGLPVALYKPLEVKQFVTSYGRGGKDQVALMVQALLNLDEPPKPSDAADALAVALCHCLKRSAISHQQPAISLARER